MQLFQASYEALYSDFFKQRVSDNYVSYQIAVNLKTSDQPFSDYTENIQHINKQPISDNLSTDKPLSEKLALDWSPSDMEGEQGVRAHGVRDQGANDQEVRNQKASDEQFYEENCPSQVTGDLATHLDKQTCAITWTSAVRYHGQNICQEQKYVGFEFYKFQNKEYIILK